MHKIDSTTFLKSIFPNNELIELRFFANNNPQERKFINAERTDQLISLIENANGKKDCYFGVAARKSKDNGRKENCSTLSALFVDIDYGSDGHKKESLFKCKEDVLDHIERFPIKPNIIVNSGHGYHLYWLFDKPLELNDENMRRAEDTMKKFSMILGGDTTYDVSRILRIPNTYNLKNENKILSTIEHYQTENLYSFDDLEIQINNLDLFNLPWQTIKHDNYTIELNGIKTKRGDAYLRAIFGSNHFQVDDRSQLDSKIVFYLLKRGFSDNQINLIFEYFSTTGKYHERKKLNPSNAHKYIYHTISKVKEFANTKINENKNLSNQNISEVNMNETQNDSTDFNSTTFSDSEIIDNPAFKCIGNLAMTTQNNIIGYYEQQLTTKERFWVKLTNFVMNLDHQIKTTIDQEPYSCFSGKIILNNGEELNFDNLPAVQLANSSDLLKFITNLCGTKTSFLGKSKSTVEAIKSFNREIPVYEAADYGYDKGLSQYITEDLTITKTDFLLKHTPLKFKDIWNDNKLCFKAPSEQEFKDVRDDILLKLMKWDKPEVVMTSLAFAMLPLIYPFIKDSMPNKSYIMLRGASGSGKTMMCRMMQRFYGKFNSLTGWTSTDTSINTIGHSFKDALFTIDDLKEQNFPTENDRKKAMRLLQNYSDNYSRNRANVNLKIKDPKILRGFVMISAEDIVFTESSTLARGIIVDVQSKDSKFEEAEQLEAISKNFYLFTPFFIRYILNNYSSEMLKELFFKSQLILKKALEDLRDITIDNQSRIINNFSLLSVSWRVLLDFMYDDEDFDLLIPYGKLMEDFNSSIYSLIISNIKRIAKSKPEIKFEETLWNCTETGLFKFENVSSNEYSDNKGKIVGWYRRKDNDIKICINLKTAYKEINQYLRDEGGIGTSFDTLVTKLTKDRKITTTPSGKIHLNEYNKKRGYEWIGKFPRELFGLTEELEETDADDDIFVSKQNNPISWFDQDSEDLPF